VNLGAVLAWLLLTRRVLSAHRSLLKAADTEQRSDAA